MAAEGLNVGLRLCKLRFYEEITKLFQLKKMRFLAYRTGGNRICYEQSMNADHKSLEILFSIANCCQSGDN